MMCRLSAQIKQPTDNRAKPLPPMERALNFDLESVVSATSHHSSLFYSKEKTAGNRSSGGSFVLALAK